jgi:hypothetical protein
MVRFLSGWPLSTCAVSASLSACRYGRNVPCKMCVSVDSGLGPLPGRGPPLAIKPLHHESAQNRLLTHARIRAVLASGALSTGGRMFRIIAVTAVACVALQVGLMTAQSATDRTAVQKQILADEKAVIDALTKGDAKSFDSYVLPDSYFPIGGVVLKAADVVRAMKEMTKGCGPIRVALTESIFYWVSDSTVVHIYKATATSYGICQDGPIPTLLSSTVWTNRGGKWLAAFHQDSYAMIRNYKPQF